MAELAERAWFHLCLALGRLLRAATYSSTRIVSRGDDLEVRKNRSFHAPLLILLAEPLVRILDTGVRVLRRREWVERERVLYRDLYDTAIQIEADGVLLLPHLPGRTLALLLEDPTLGPCVRKRAIECAVIALVGLHRMGFTHGDAMAENVMVDLDAGVARWFDFETVHDSDRPLTWRRADDVRALIATCVLRTPPPYLARTAELILDGYADEEVSGLVAAHFTSPLRRPLSFHLGQAPLSFECYHEIAGMLRPHLSRAARPDSNSFQSPRAADHGEDTE